MLYNFLSVFFRWAFKALCGTVVVGAENVPQKGALILAANHQSNWDPPFLATYIDRHVHYMAKEELFKNPIFSAIIKNLHAFPVKRGTADRGAIKNALAILKNDHCLGLFPEGTRSKDGTLGKAEAGVGLIAAMSKAQVVPAAIIGTSGIFGQKWFPRLKVIYGKPFSFSGKSNDKEALQRFSDKIMEEIGTLLEEHQKESA